MTAPFAYAGDIAWLIRRFKFNGDLSAGRALAHCMRDAKVMTPDPSPSVEMLVPVPLHDDRLRERGFDQAAELARDLGSSFGIEVSHALVRLRATRPQTGMSDSASRRQNLRGAFAANPARLRGRKICLIDDVMTTGSTIQEASRAARAAGARSIDVWCCARTTRQH